MNEFLKKLRREKISLKDKLNKIEKETSIDQESINEIFHNKKFICNKDPFFFKYFSLEEHNKLLNENKFFKTKLNNLTKIGYKANKIFASLWFGLFLLAMQSYFLRQNLALTDLKFISD
jgi:hypothetical protein